MKPNILIVEDQKDIRELLSFYLLKEGFSVEMASNGQVALDKVGEVFFDLIIVDVMMPIMDGITFVKELKNFRDIPVIMLTAKQENKDILDGFALGVDDYMTKPFDPQELIARVRAILKRCSVNTSNIITIGNLLFDSDKCELRYYDEQIHLPLKQFELLFELAKKPNQIFSRELLLEKIWGMSYEGFDRTVDVHIKRIRENLQSIPEIKIITHRGLGYKLEVK